MPSNRCLAIGLAIALVLSLVFLVALLTLTYFYTQNELCLSTECIRSAASLLTSMDPTVNPCHNFNDFVCGRWRKNHHSDSYSKISWFTEMTPLIDKGTTEYMKQKDSADEPEAVHKARALYRGCLDKTSMDKVGLAELDELLENGLQLTLLPPMGQAPGSPMKTAAYMKTQLDKNVLFGFELGQLPENRTQVRLAFTPPSDEYIASVRKPDKGVTVLGIEMPDVYKTGLVKFLEYFPANTREDFPDKEKRLDEAADLILEMMIGLISLKQNAEVKKEMASQELKEYTVPEFQRILDQAAPSGKSKIAVKNYITGVYEDIADVKLDLDGSDTLLVMSMTYFKELSEFLDNIENSQIELYLWYQTVVSLAAHVNTEMGNLRRFYDLAVSGGGKTLSREEICLDVVTKVMKPAVSYYLVQEPSVDERRQKVQEMISSLKESFLQSIENLDWMDKETKEKTKEKIHAMEVYVGFLNSLKDKDKLNKLYNVPVEEKTYLKSLLSLIQNGIKKELSSLRKPYYVDLSSLDTLTVNAFYNQQENDIFVPIGILQFPFYDLGLEALNYGAIGTILGHEITHGFDDTGRDYDKEGNKKNWWSDESRKEYSERAECYVNKYSKIKIHRLNATVDGELTLGENIADDGGIKEALESYRSYVKKNGEERKLPGLSQYNHEQLFFMSYAHAWCAEYLTDEELEEGLEDTHVPDFARTVAVLSNMKEFGEVWSCPAGSPMIQESRCRMWDD